jgi:hypothetical protein
MTEPAPLRTVEILMLAADHANRPQLTAQALTQLRKFDPAAIFPPVRLRIRQHARDIFDQSGPLHSVLYALTEWGYRNSHAPDIA